MAGQPGWFDLDRRYAALSAAGDPRERLALGIDFELFRDRREAALARSDRAKGGRPRYDAVLMFKVLVLQTLYTLADDQTAYQSRDRFSFMRFLAPALPDPVPDAKTIWLYREQLTKAGAIERLFVRFDAALREAGYRAMAGQIVDATVVEARRPRLTQDEKATMRAGAVPAARSKAKRAQMDTDGRWTIKRGRQPSADEGEPQARVAEIAVPVFGYKNHREIDRRYGFIRRFAVTDAAAHDGRQLSQLLDPAHTASSVWADSAYRSAANVALLARRGLVPPFQRPKPRGRRMPSHRVRGNARRAGAGRDRTRLRRPEMPAWPGHPLGRPGPRHRQAGARQPGHQPVPARLVRNAGTGLTSAEQPTTIVGGSPAPFPPADHHPPPAHRASITPENTVLRGVHPGTGHPWIAPSRPAPGRRRRRDSQGRMDRRNDWLTTIG
jgi:IS5 family transposase